MRPMIKFNLTTDDIERPISDHLATQYSVKKEPRNIYELSYFDTFDWRLFKKSLLLFSFHNHLILREMGQETIIHSFFTKKVPRFEWEFPKSDLKQYLKPIIKMRRLLELVQLVNYTEPYRLLNQDEKTVAKILFESIRIRNKKEVHTLGTQLWLLPVKGYPKHAKKVKNQIESLGLRPSRNEDVFFQAMDKVGRDPGSYSSKLRLRLTADMRADEATMTIFRFLLQIIKTNETQLKHDIDTEILHDYRVAIRRTRSALVWDKNIFNKDTMACFQKDLSFIGKQSNELRDLDVYLLSKPKYKALLPERLRDDIDPLFDYLSKQRAAAFRKVIRSLRSKKYRKIMQDWEFFINEPQENHALGSNAAMTVFELAGKKIYKQFKTVVKAGNRILENSDDEKLHKLRIQCKKLRYLIQFFSNLFPADKINVLVSQLKNLQAMLGNYNDLCVQVDYLLNVAKEMPANLSQLNQTLVAIGSLIGKLETTRHSVKASFAETFTQFTSAQNQKLFHNLFARQLKQVVS